MYFFRKAPASVRRISADSGDRKGLERFLRVVMWVTRQD